VKLRVLSGPLSNFTDLAADDSTTALIINVITAVGQFQRDLQNELTAEGITAAEAGVSVVCSKDPTDLPLTCGNRGQLLVAVGAFDALCPVRCGAAYECDAALVDRVTNTSQNQSRPPSA
jgi:hypothetical protein